MPPMIVAALFALLCASLAAPLSAPPASAAPTLPGAARCQTPLPAVDGAPAELRWSDAERWAWDRICLGKEASMNLKDPEPDLPCNPAGMGEDAPANRALSADFLRLILTRAPWSAAPPTPRVMIACARIEGALDLAEADIAPSVMLWGAHLPRSATLRDARFARTLHLGGATFSGALNAQSLRVGGSLFLRGGASFEDIDLSGARVGGALDASGSTFFGTLDANGLSVGGALFLGGGSSFADVELVAATVAGAVDATGASFSGLLDASALNVGGALFLAGANFTSVDLTGARVEGAAEVTGSTFAGGLYASGLSVGGSMFLHGGTLFADIDLVAAKIGETLELGDSRFGGHVDMSGAQVAGELLLSNARLGWPEWGPQARLSLRNAAADALQAGPEAWRRADGGWLETDLSGFEYRRLGGLFAEEADSMADQSVGWFRDWLAAQTGHGARYDPQPYRALASALEGAGAEAAAKAVRYARFEHRRATSNAPWEQAALLASRVFIGHGVYPFRLLGWFVLLVALGLAAGWRSRAAELRGWGARLWFSLENALPLMEPGARFAAVAHGDSRVEGFFHFQKIAGFVMGAALVGALALPPG